MGLWDMWIVGGMCWWDVLLGCVGCDMWILGSPRYDVWFGDMGGLWDHHRYASPVTKVLVYDDSNGAVSPRGVSR